MLEPEIIEKLKQPLDTARIKTRQGGGGMQLAYIKGHDAIDTANHLFGFGNWGFDLLSNELINVLGEGGEILGGYYAARLKLTIAGCVPITEEGVCPIQEGRNPRAKIDAHDMARKGAITDALKRALRCYGDQFGNSLYDNEPGSDAYQATHKDQRQPQAQAATQAQRPQAAAPQQPQPQTARPVTQPAPVKPNPAPVANGEKATDPQTTAILRMAGKQGWEEIELNNRLKELYGYGLSQLTKNDAGHFIQVLQSK